MSDMTWYARSDTATTDGNRDPLFRHGIGAAFCVVEATNRVPSHLTPATRISRIKGGQWVALDVFMQYGAAGAAGVGAEAGAERAHGVCAAREDAKAVMEAVSGDKNG